MAEQPKYGWYVKNLIIGFNIVGFLGLIAFVFGWIITGFLGIIFIIMGIATIMVFLWPGIGMILMHLLLLNKINLVAKMTPLRELENLQILDVGCGTGRTAIKIAKELRNNGHLYGIDIYSKFAISGNDLETVQNNARIEQVKEKTTFQFGSATEIPFEDNRFDLVDISSVLHELPKSGEQDKAVSELYQVLKPGGYLYLSEWNRTSWQCIAFFGICCFVFQKKEHWEKLLHKYNFKDIKYENNSGFILFIARK